MKLCKCGCGKRAKEGNVFLRGHSGGRRRNVLERFWSSITDTGDCWIWTGAQDGRGYGSFAMWVRPGKVSLLKAYRFAYELVRAVEIPEGMQLDHLCRNRICVNPAHLQVVTQQENIRRGEKPNRTHCVNGHPYDDKNTARYAHGRTCRACYQQRNRERHDREKRSRGNATAAV